MPAPYPLIRGIVLAVGLAVPLAAHAADPALVQAATKEGSVSWYTSLVANQTVRPLTAAFEKKYPGIKVDATVGGGIDLDVKVRLEGQAHTMHADVYHGGSAIGGLKAQGLIEPYFPESARHFPPEMKDAEGYWTAEVVNVYVAAVNTDLVSPADEPKTLADLLKPRWKSQIALTNSLTQGGAAGFVGSVMLTMGNDAGLDYLKKLSPQLVSVLANVRVVLDQVIAGQYPMAVMTAVNHSVISKKQGAPIKWLKLEPAVQTLDTVFLLKGAPHPNAGKLLIDFLVSREGQEVFRDASSIPADPDVPPLDSDTRPDKGGFKAVVLKPELVEKELPGWVDIYNKLLK